MLTASKEDLHIKCLILTASVTYPPYEYIGLGYNILMGNPESRTDPGLKITERIFQVNYQLILNGLQFEFCLRFYFNENGTLP